MILPIIEQVLIALPLILGAYLTLSLLKLPDFSIESAYLFGAVAAFLAKDLPLPLIFLSAAGGGIFVGLTVSFINQTLKIPFLLAAIITNGIFHGTTQVLLGTSLKSMNINFPELTVMVILAGVLLALLAVFLRSELGFSLAIFGTNPQFFKCHKISGRYVVFMGVALGHGLAGLSGFLFAKSNGFVDLTMNFGIILLCLTALIIGKLGQKNSKPSVLIPLLGIAAYFVIQQLLLNAGLNLKFFNAFQALFVLAILVLGKKKHALTLDHLGV